MKFFAIRHVPTGKLMPDLGRGSTAWEPFTDRIGHSKQKKKQLRLFTEVRHAKSVIKW